MSALAPTALRRNAGLDLPGWAALAATVCIWAAFFLSLRAGALGHLPVAELALIRFGPAGVLFTPLLWRRRARLLAAGWPALLLIVAAAGLPYFLVAAYGTRFAPVSDASTLVPGTVPLAVAALLELRGRRDGVAAPLPLALIGLGVVVMLALSLAHGQPGQWRGDLVFLGCAALWAVYTVTLRGSGLAALDSAALLAVGSLLGLMLWWPFSPALQHLDGLRALPLHELLVQIAVQGVAVGLLSAFTYGMAVTRLGAGTAAAGGALTPVVATALAWPLLGEVPQPATLAAMACIVVGVLWLQRRG